MQYTAAMYDMPFTTLVDQRAGKPLQYNCKLNRKKLTKLEEEVIVEHILNLNSQGFSPTLTAVQGMANKLFAKYNTG